MGGTVVAGMAAGHTEHHTHDIVAVPEQHSTHSIVVHAPVAATADAAHTLTMLSSMHSAPPQTCLKTALETSECLAAVLHQARLEAAPVHGAVEAGSAWRTDHQRLEGPPHYSVAVRRSTGADIACRKETAAGIARRLQEGVAGVDGIALLAPGHRLEEVEGAVEGPSRLIRRRRGSA